MVHVVIRNSTKLLLRGVLVLRVPHGKILSQESRMAQHIKSATNKLVT